MDRNSRVEELKKIAKRIEFEKTAQQIADNASQEADAEASFNKMFAELLHHIEIPSIDDI
jgi:hypothetical protein